MDAVPDFLKEDQAEREELKLDDLAPLVELFKDRCDEVARLTEELERAKAAKNKLGREHIPEIMRYLGYTEIKLATGEKLKVKEEASVSIPEGKEQAFLDFLKSRNEEDIVKLQLWFSRMPNEQRETLLALLEANGFEPEVKEGVHQQTLKAYFKKLLGVGEEDREEGIKSGKYLHPDAVRDFASIFVYYDTSVSAPKGSRL
jgi:hypothetical protein